MEVGKISVGIEARLAKLEAGLARAAVLVKTETAKMQKAAQPELFGRVGDQLLKLGTGLAGITGALRGITALSEAFKGNMEEANQLLRSVPLLGGLAGSFADMFMSLTGANDRLKSINNELVKATRESKALADQIERRDKAIAAAAKLRTEGINVIGGAEGEFRRKANLLGEKEGFPRERLALEQEFNQDTSRLRAEGQRTGIDPSFAIKARTEVFQKEHIALADKFQKESGERFADYMDAMFEAAMDEGDAREAGRKYAKELQQKAAQEAVDRFKVMEDYNEKDREDEREQRARQARNAEQIGAEQVVLSRIASQSGKPAVPRSPQIDTTNRNLDGIKTKLDKLIENTLPDPFRANPFGMNA